MGRKKLWQYAASLLPKSGAATFNSALLDLGALICVARKPKCDVCPVELFCRAKIPSAIPVRKSKPKPKKVIEAHALIVRAGRILLEQSCHRWRGMWILPRLNSSFFKKQRFQRRPVYESVFPFTHHRVTLSVYRRPAPKRIAFAQRWFESIEHVAIPSPHRRAMEALLGVDFSLQHEKQDSAGNGS